MHVDSGLRLGMAEEADASAAPAQSRPVSYAGSAEEDKELQAIFERTYGPVRAAEFSAAPPSTAAEEPAGRDVLLGSRPEYLLVDGYNIIFAWDELKEAAGTMWTRLCSVLMDLLCSYQGYRKCRVILVFDAYGFPRSWERCYATTTSTWSTPREAGDCGRLYPSGPPMRWPEASGPGGYLGSAEQLIILGHSALGISGPGTFRQEDWTGPGRRWPPSWRGTAGEVRGGGEAMERPEGRRNERAGREEPCEHPRLPAGRDRAKRAHS